MHDFTLVCNESGCSAGENGVVTYSLVSGVDAAQPEFGVFPDGSIYVAQKLDRETKVIHHP